MNGQPNRRTTPGYVKTHRRMLTVFVCYSVIVAFIWVQVVIVALICIHFVMVAFGGAYGTGCLDEDLAREASELPFCRAC